MKIDLEGSVGAGLEEEIARIAFICIGASRLQVLRGVVSFSRCPTWRRSNWQKFPQFWHGGPPEG